MSEMTVTQAVARALVKEQVDYVFGISGALSPLFDEISGTEGINFVLTRHEQGAAFMACGYALAAKRPGVCISIGGPGATNLLSGVAVAHTAGIPVIALTRTENRPMLGRQSFQDIDHIPIFTPITKWSYMVPTGEAVPWVMRRAFQLALANRPGPVHLAFPGDILGQQIEVEDLEPEQYRVANTTPCDEAKVEQVIELLKKAKQPVIIAGDEVLREGATARLIALAELLKVPVATIRDHLDAFPTVHPQSVGPIGFRGWDIANSTVAQADLLLAIGVRFDSTSTSGYSYKIIPQNAKIAHVSQHAEQIGTHYPVAVGVVGSTTSFLDKITQKAKSAAVKGDWLDIKALRQEWEEKRLSEIDARAKPIQHAYVIRTLRKLLDKDALIVWDATASWATPTRRHIDTYEPDTIIQAFNIGSVGYGFPAAIGAKAARPERQVVCLTGDMGFAMNSAELETAVRAGLKVTVIVFNDFGVSSVRDGHKRQPFPLLTDYGSQDFSQLARVFAADGERVSEPGDVAGAIERALASEKPAVVDILV
ncbi:MAG: thiamine pyrophosphate-binding protein [Chloroflexota bacterium]